MATLSINIDRCPKCGARDSFFKAIRVAITESLDYPDCVVSQYKNGPDPNSYIECADCNTRWISERSLAADYACSLAAGRISQQPQHALMHKNRE